MRDELLRSEERASPKRHVYGSQEKYMSFTSVVYGRILSGSSIDENRKVIDNLDDEQPFPWILKEMFNFSALERPYYFGSQMITFGATYKQVEDDLTSWIIKFESILTKLDFITAKIQIETEVYGTYDFFWKNKKYTYGNHDDALYLEMGLQVARDWYFGYGKRSMWGTPIEDDLDYITIIHNLIQPFELTDYDKKLLNKLSQHVEMNKLTYFYDLPDIFTQDRDRLYQLLTKLQTENRVDFKAKTGNDPLGKEKFGPYFIIKRKLVD